VRKKINDKIKACTATPAARAEVVRRYQSIRGPTGMVRPALDMFNYKSKFKSKDWLVIIEHLATYLFDNVLPNNVDANNAILAVTSCLQELAAREYDQAVCISRKLIVCHQFNSMCSSLIYVLFHRICLHCACGSDRPLSSPMNICQRRSSPWYSTC
jgi:hypothetical protein